MTQLKDSWKKQIKKFTPHSSFEEVKIAYALYSNQWQAQEQGPAPACFPSQEDMENSNLSRIIKKHSFQNYTQLLGFSQKHRKDFLNLFFEEKNFHFKKKPNTVFEATSAETIKWLPGAEFNIFDSCFLAPPEKIALCFQTEKGTLQEWTYQTLYQKATHVALALKKNGFKKGDAIAIDMTFTAECVALYLGIIGAGMKAVSIADSFAPEEIEVRLKISNAKAIFTQDFTLRGDKKIPLYAKVCEANAPTAIVLAAYATSEEPNLKLREKDLSWSQFLKGTQPCEWLSFPSETLTAQDDLNILFSSGTTGDPKAIPWSHATPFKCAMDGYFHHNIQEDSICAWPTNMGWMMGPWLVFASLLNKAQLALYYGAPTTLEFCQFIEKANVTVLGTIPSLLKSWKNAALLDQCDWSRIKVLSSTGECSNPEDMLYLIHKTGFKPIIEYCGGTEIGGGYLTGTVIHPCAPSTFSTTALGSEILILDENEKETQNGEVFLIPPSLGLSTHLLNKDHSEVYFKDTPTFNGKKLRRHGDQVERLEKGYFRMHGRVDDTMNLGGIKTSSAEIERVLNQVENVLETAAIAVPPPSGGPSLLVIFCVLKNRHATPNQNLELQPLLQEAIKNELNPLFKIHALVLQDSLPRTASNKIMRRELRKAYTS